MYDSGRLVIHDLDRTTKSCLWWRSVENSVCKPRCPSKIFKFVQQRDNQFLSKDPHMELVE